MTTATGERSGRMIGKRRIPTPILPAARMSFVLSAIGLLTIGLTHRGESLTQIQRPPHSLGQQDPRTVDPHGNQITPKPTQLSGKHLPKKWTTRFRGSDESTPFGNVLGVRQG